MQLFRQYKAACPLLRNATLRSVCSDIPSLCRAALKRMPDDVTLMDSDMEDAVDELLQNGPVAAPASDQDDDSDALPTSDNAASEDSDEAGVRHAGQKARKAHDLTEADYDALLAGKERRRGAAGSAEFGEAFAVAMDEDSDGDGGSDHDSGSDGEGDDDQHELLPTEDEFLRLADMEAFVRQGEAAEELGDRGGLSRFDAAAARGAREGSDDEGDADADGGELGDGDALARAGGADGRLAGASDDADDEDGDGSDIDLFAAGESGSDVGELEGEDDEGGIMYEAFFGKRKPAHAARPAAAATQRAAKAARDVEHRAGDADSPSSDDADVAGLAAEAASDDASGSEDYADMGDSDSDADAATAQLPGPPTAAAEPSPHARRTARIREQIAEMEEAAMRGQDWHMRGEASAGTRPIDSALELDLDFEQTLRPPPQPTVEAALALEDVIKARIRELRFDNVVRVAVAAPRKERAALEASDQKSKAGLADLYEGDGDGAAHAGGASADRQAKIRTVCSLSVELCMLLRKAATCGFA